MKNNEMNLAIDTLNLAELLRAECDDDGKGKYNLTEWRLADKTVTDIILNYFGDYDYDFVRVEYLQGGLKFRVAAEYEKAYCATFTDAKDGFKSLNQIRRAGHTVTAALAEFTLPAFLEMRYPGGIRAAFELAAELTEFDAELDTTNDMWGKIDNSNFNSPSADLRVYPARTDLENLINGINARGGKITARALGAIMGMPWDKDDLETDDHLSHLWTLFKYSYGKLGICIAVNMGTSMHVEFDEFFNSPFDILPPQLYKDQYRVPTFKGILKGVQFGSEFGGNLW